MLSAFKLSVSFSTCCIAQCFLHDRNSDFFKTHRWATVLQALCLFCRGKQIIFSAGIWASLQLREHPTLRWMRTSYSSLSVVVCFLWPLGEFLEYMMELCQGYHSSHILIFPDCAVLGKLTVSVYKSQCNSLSCYLQQPTGRYYILEWCQRMVTVDPSAGSTSGITRLLEGSW